MLRFFLFVFLLASFAVSAQQRPKDLEPLPEVPSIDGAQSADEPQVTIIQRGDNTVEEYRIKGQLYMMKITPKHGVPYYLVDRQGAGQFTRMDALDSGFTVPMWVIIRF